MLKWCPKEGNVIRGILGSLKAKQAPVPLKVYPTQVAQDGSLAVKLV